MRKVLLFMIMAIGLCHSIEVCSQVRKKTPVKKTVSQGGTITSKKIVEKDGYVWIQTKQGKKYGAKTPEGKVIVPLKYDTVKYESSASFPAQFNVKSGNFWGVYMPNGEYAIAIDRNYNAVYYHYNGGVYYWLIYTKTGGFGILDNNKNVIVEPNKGFTHCQVMENDGYRYILTKDKGDNYGLCDMSGRELISPSEEYSFCIVQKHDDQNYYITVNKGDNRGLYDMNGNMLISPHSGYTYCSVKSGGRVTVEKDGEFKEIDLPRKSSSSYAHSSSSSYGSTSVVSSSSSSNSGSPYSCNYTQSSQGRNVKTGQYTDAMAGDWQINVVFYDDYILVNGEKYNYWGMANGMKSYMRDDFTGARNIYNVDTNYNLQYFSSRSNPYTGGYDLWSYEVRKGNTSTPKYSNNAGGYSNNNSGYSGTSTTTATSSSSSSSSNTYQRSCTHCLGSGKCTYCNGSGYVTRLGMGSGTHYCAICINHNGICKYCKGTGKQ